MVAESAASSDANGISESGRVATGQARDGGRVGRKFVALLGHDADADVHALIANVRAWPSDQHPDVTLRLVAERAPQKRRRCACATAESPPQTHERMPPNGLRLSGRRKPVRCSRGFGARLLNTLDAAILRRRRAKRMLGHLIRHTFKPPSEGGRPCRST